MLEKKSTTLTTRAGVATLIAATWVVTALLASAAARAQVLEPAQFSVADLGPEVGENIPEFSLIGQDGEIWTEESILGENGAMLVFIRSADW